MKNAVFWEVKTQFVPHRRQITSPLQRTAGLVRFEVSTAVTMKNSVFWDVMQCASCKKRRFGGSSVLTKATQHISDDGILDIT
jgi:hypothetical protein